MCKNHCSCAFWIDCPNSGKKVGAVFQGKIKNTKLKVSHTTDLEKLMYFKLFKNTYRNFAQN
jgi:hypothetical protein